ncbi:MAG: hypothetical protein K9N23_06580 [Akkermansiaceae bacterium]|nr:hypothetical protein [Akkermansiaceae bacterium]MCF7731332.1 hypothetical protein [Akkermansiaceae bacterium]
MNNNVGIDKIMKKAFAIVALLSAMLGCSPSDRKIESNWSEPANGLQFQIAPASQFHRNRDGVAMIEATCTIKNTGSVRADVTHLARLYVVDSAGVTSQCQRREDVADLVPARPTVAPGDTTSWLQDGQIKVVPGVYDLYAVWDGNMNLKSPSVRITIK